MVEKVIAPGDETAGDTLGVSEQLLRLNRIEAGTGTERDFVKADWTFSHMLDATLASAVHSPAR